MTISHLGARELVVRLIDGEISVDRRGALDDPQGFGVLIELEQRTAQVDLR